MRYTGEFTKKRVFICYHTSWLTRFDSIGIGLAKGSSFFFFKKSAGVLVESCFRRKAKRLADTVEVRGFVERIETLLKSETAEVRNFTQRSDTS